MGKTSIEWTRNPDGTPGKTWNPVRGCSRVSPGCVNCYAEKIAARFSGPGLAFEGFARVAGGRDRKNRETGELTVRGGTPQWTGKVALVPDALDAPLRWRKPQRIFVNSMSDLFHEALPDEAIDRVFAVMARAPRHTFMILTKRPDRMRSYFERWPNGLGRGHHIALRIGDGKGPTVALPLPNVWLGVSVEDQQRADERIPLLLQTPAAVRFLSVEPLLGPVDLSAFIFVPTRCRACGSTSNYYDANPKGLPPAIPDQPTCLMGAPLTGEPGAVRCAACESLDVEEQRPVDLIIVGSESGPGARSMDEDWVRALRDQGVAAGSCFFYKQKTVRGRKIPLPLLDGRQWAELPEVAR